MLLEMKKQELIKQLQNLFSWKQFYQLTENFEMIEITQKQIAEQQKLIDENNRR